MARAAFARPRQRVEGPTRLERPASGGRVGEGVKKKRVPGSLSRSVFFVYVRGRSVEAPDGRIRRNSLQKNRDGKR